MKVQKINHPRHLTKLTVSLKNSSSVKALLALMIFALLSVSSVSAHCDSYDGPLIKDALKAIETNDVQPTLKWIDEPHEEEIIHLFNKTISMKQGDKEIYEIVEKHFLETLVRLHREGEGAPFTGLKPAGSASKIVVMADDALATGSIDDLKGKLTAHIELMITTKYNNAIEAKKTKDHSVEEGRAFVKAYVEYTHYLEDVHEVIAGNSDHTAHNK